MKFGAHLPLIGFDDRTPSLDALTRYVTTARDLGFTTITANDHLVFPRPWLDGPTALAAVLPASGNMDLMTTVSIPVVRGLMQTATSLAAIDILSGGRLTVGIGPGSSQRDYAAVGVPFEERWKRLDEMVPALRALWIGEAYHGRFYSTDGIEIQPRPSRGSLPIWIGSWGSDAGLRRVARLADGWLASAYNTTPDQLRESREQLAAALSKSGRGMQELPNAIATMFMWITKSKSEAQTVIRDVVAPTIRRPEEELATRLLIGHPSECAEKLSRYRESGVQQVFLWPIRDEVRQLQTFVHEVQPLIR